MKTIAFLFGYGSEVRQFVHSGLARSLAKRNKVIIYSRIASEELVALCAEDRLTLEVLKTPGLTRAQRGIFAVCERVFFSKIKTEDKFSYFGPRERAETAALSSSNNMIWKWILRALNRVEERVFTSTLAESPEAKQLQRDGVDAIIFNVPRSEYVLRYAYAARKLGRKAFLLFHTFKEVDANGRFGVPADRYLIWDANFRKQMIRLNPHIKKDAVVVSGSLYYDFDSGVVPSARQKVVSELGLAGEKYVLYCAGNPRSLVGEERFVAALHETLRRDARFQDYSLVVRTNPMDDNPARWDLGLDYYAVNVPKWVWLPESNWNEATREDVATYWALVKNADCTIGGASTVTADSLVMGTPVLNFTEDLRDTDGGLELPFGYFWEAGFYRPFKQLDAVVGAVGLGDFAEALAKTVRTKVSFDWREHCGFESSLGPVEFARQQIEASL